MSKTVDFYFDFSSSYSYIAVHRLQEVAGKHGLEVNWKPIALGAIFKNLNHAPPSGDSIKGRYIWHDVQRSAEQSNLRYHWPEPFPFNSMAAARIYWHLAGSDQQQAVAWMLAAFRCKFRPWKGLFEPGDARCDRGGIGTRWRGVACSNKRRRRQTEAAAGDGRGDGEGRFRSANIFL